MRLANQAAVMISGRLAERIIGLLSGMVLVRLLTKDEYGSFLQIGLISQLGAALFVFGLPHSLLYLVPRVQREARKHVILATGRLMVVLPIIGGAALALSGPLVVRAFNNPALASFSLLIGLYTLFHSLDRMVEPGLVALGEAWRAGALAAVSSVFIVVVTLTPAWNGWGLQGIFAGVLVVTLARLGYFGIILGRLPGIVPGTRVEGFTIRSVLAFAVPMGLSAMATQYNRLLDGLMVSFLFTPAAYAVYARGAFELPLVDLVPYTLANVILPRLVELWKAGDRIGFLGLWNRLIRVSGLCIIPALIYSLMFADEIIVTLFSEAYHQSVPVFQIYLLSLPLRLTSFGVLLQAIGDSRAILYATLWSLGLSLILGPALCLQIGPVGAAAGFLGSQLLWTLCLQHAIRKRTDFVLGELMPWSHLVRVTGIVLAAGVPVKLLGALATSPFLTIVLTGPPFVLLCLGGFLWFNLVDAPEKDVLQRCAWRLRVGRREAPGGSRDDGAPGA